MTQRRPSGAPDAVSPSAPALRPRVIDAAVAAWVVVWLVLAVAAALEVRRLAELSDTAVAAGSALESTADALDSLSGVPFLDRRLGPLEQRVRRGGELARAGGRDARRSIERASILLGLALALGPTVPLVALRLTRPAARAPGAERR